MDSWRWRRLRSILDELGTVDLLRRTVSSDQLYLVDLVARLIADIERIGELEEDRGPNLFGDDE
jgi:hypothetical protein